MGPLKRQTLFTEHESAEADGQVTAVDGRPQQSTQAMTAVKRKGLIGGGIKHEHITDIDPHLMANVLANDMGSAHSNPSEFQNSTRKGRHPAAASVTQFPRNSNSLTSENHGIVPENRLSDSWQAGPPQFAHHATEPMYSDASLAQDAQAAQILASSQAHLRMGAFPHGYKYLSILSRYIPNAADAHAIFFRFARQMAPRLPIVVFPEHTSPDGIHATKPTLFLAAISVAAPSHIQVLLLDEVLRILSNLIIVLDEKSLELIQALQVIIMWYRPAEGQDARCEQLCSMARTMAAGIGMDIPSEDRKHWSSWAAKHPDHSAEGARSFVGCFILDTMYVLTLWTGSA